jgi:hypothetical protein
MMPFAQPAIKYPVQGKKTPILDRAFAGPSLATSQKNLNKRKVTPNNHE